MKTIHWILANDWRGLAALVVVQALTVGAFFWFAHWLTDYARLNWY